MQRRQFFKLALGAAAAVSVGLPAIASTSASVHPLCAVASPPTSYLTLAELERIHACLMAASSEVWVDRYRSEYRLISEGNDKPGLAPTNPAQSSSVEFHTNRAKQAE